MVANLAKINKNRIKACKKFNGFKGKSADDKCLILEASKCLNSDGSVKFGMICSEIHEHIKEMFQICSKYAKAKNRTH